MTLITLAEIADNREPRVFGDMEVDKQLLIRGRDIYGRIEEILYDANGLPVCVIIENYDCAYITLDLRFFERREGGLN